jgi:hypothetical protein
VESFTFNAEVDAAAGAKKTVPTATVDGVETPSTSLPPLPPSPSSLRRDIGDTSNDVSLPLVGTLPRTTTPRPWDPPSSCPTPPTSAPTLSTVENAEEWLRRTNAVGKEEGGCREEDDDDDEARPPTASSASDVESVARDARSGGRAADWPGREARGGPPSPPPPRPVAAPPSIDARFMREDSDCDGDVAEDDDIGLLKSPTSSSTFPPR